MTSRCLLPDLTASPPSTSLFLLSLDCRSSSGLSIFPQSSCLETSLAVLGGGAVEQSLPYALPNGLAQGLGSVVIEGVGFWLGGVGFLGLLPPCPRIMSDGAGGPRLRQCPALSGLRASESVLSKLPGRVSIMVWHAAHLDWVDEWQPALCGLGLQAATLLIISSWKWVEWKDFRKFKLREECCGLDPDCQTQSRHRMLYKEKSCNDFENLTKKSQAENLPVVHRCQQWQSFQREFQPASIHSCITMEKSVLYVWVMVLVV